MSYEVLREGTPERRHRCKTWRWVGARRGSLARCTVCGTLYERTLFGWRLHKMTADKMVPAAGGISGRSSSDES